MMAANGHLSGRDERLFVPGTETSREFRTALGTFATGVTVVTAMGDQGPMGMTANSFTSLSLDPPLVLWSPAKNSSKHGGFTTAAHFAIHVLGEEQDGLSASFTRGGTAFDGLAWEINAEGAPVIPGTLARFECALHAVHDGGDHSIVIGRVLRVAQRDGAPLCFSQGAFGRFARMT